MSNESTATEASRYIMLNLTIPNFFQLNIKQRFSGCLESPLQTGIVGTELSENLEYHFCHQVHTVLHLASVDSDAF